MPKIFIAPVGYRPAFEWQCSQRGDVWNEVVASEPKQAAIQQAKLWMEKGYRLPMLVMVRANESSTIVTYRVECASVAASIVDGVPNARP